LRNRKAKHERGINEGGQASNALHVINFDPIITINKNEFADQII
jgi:hypothetical protein